MKKLATLVLSFSLSVAVLGGLPGASATGSSAACSGRAVKIMKNAGAMEQYALRTFNIAVKAPKNVHIGDTLVIPVVVTRPAEQDPLGQGIPTDGIEPEAAPDVNVGVGLLFGDVFLPGFAVTDSKGKAKIRVKVERYVKPGPVDASFYAWKTQADTPCARVDENGYRPMPKFFTVKP